MVHRRIVLAASLLLALPAAAAPADPFTHAFTAYRGTVALDPAAGTVAVAVQADGVVSGGPRDGLFVACGLPVTGVADGDGNPLAATPASALGADGVWVVLPAPLADAAPFAITVRAEGAPDCAPRGAAGVRRCGLSASASWLDLAAVLPRSVAGLDFATLDLRVEAPAGQVLAGSGDAVEEGPATDGRTAWRLRQDVPAYTRGLALGPWERGVLPAADGTVRTFSGGDAAVRDGAAAVLARASSAWTAFAADLGPASSPSLSLAQVDGVGAAMALAGLAWLPAGIWTGEGGGTLHPADLAFLVVPHEVAHQWFPVTAAPTPLGGTWIQEGLAEWMALRALAAEAGDGAARAVMRDLCLRWRLGLPAASDRALATVPNLESVTDPDAHFLLAYAKSACALATLEAAAGADAFLSVLRGLVADLRGTGRFFDGTMLRDRLAAAAPDVDVAAVWDALAGVPGVPVLRVGVRSEPGSAPGLTLVRVDLDAAASVGSSTPAFQAALAATGLAVDLRTGSGTTRLLLAPVAGEATAWAEVDSRPLDLSADPAGAWPGARILPALAGDTDLSGEVDGLDLLAVAAARGAAFPADARYREACDADGSGTVDDGDLATVVQAFGSAL